MVFIDLPGASTCTRAPPQCTSVTGSLGVVGEGSHGAEGRPSEARASATGATQIWTSAGNNTTYELG